MLMEEVKKRRLEQVDRPRELPVSTTETSRAILLHYERQVEGLPGWKRP